MTTEIIKSKPERKNAGYIITQSEEYAPHSEVVLGYNPNKGDYVTWKYDSRFSGSYFWGHYFTNMENAYIDYHERLINEYMKRKEVTL